MKSKNRFIYAVLFLLFFTGCEKNLLKEEFNNDAAGNYNAFWSEFDRYYGAFEAKNVNWDSLKVVYGNNIHQGTSNAELYHALTGLLGSLHDGHANLYAPEVGSFYSHGLTSYFSDTNTRDQSTIIFLQDLIRSKYLMADYKKIVSSNWAFFYGSIRSSNHKIGYICLPTFINTAYPDQFIKDAVTYFKSLDAVIIDVRYNGGGSTEAFVKAMDLFSTERRVYMKSKYRNGPKHSDFTPLSDHFTAPKSDNLNGKPIVVLINGQTGSSSEHLLLGLKTQPNVISIGDTTWGAFSGVVCRIMPNGWQFRLGAQVIYTPEGKLLTNAKGKYLEGIGIAPDFCVKDKLKSIVNGHDDPLESAIAKLNESIR